MVCRTTVFRCDLASKPQETTKVAAVLHTKDLPKCALQEYGFWWRASCTSQQVKIEMWGCRRIIMMQINLSQVAAVQAVHGGEAGD